MRKYFCFLIIVVFLFRGVGERNLYGQNIQGELMKTTKLFERVPPGKSSVRFVNRITPDLNTKANLFDFDYFYNGAGVGIGDFNKDGLQDIFFCGNQVPDKLYLNRGSMRFEDVTKKMQLRHIPGWSNGVCVTDVNKDGWPDIYVSRGGPAKGRNRRNLLWINHEGKYFTEEAAHWGLDDPGLSTQSAFFDYDKDGDVDCFVMNENDYYGFAPIDFYNKVGADSATFHYASSHLYRNDSGHFVDVSVNAGVLKPSFGLGLVIADINEDGWPDIYMSNDYFIPDVMFINQRDGSFRDEIKRRTQQMAFYGMGVDIGDLDNDLDQDIFVLDMAFGDHYRSKKLMRSMNVDNFRLLVGSLNLPYQYMYNALQMNNGEGEFDNVSHFAGVAKTGWSWAALIEDLDNDGLRDIFVTTGYRKYAMDNDFQRKVKATQLKYGGRVPLEEKQQLYEEMWSEKYPNVLFKNLGNMHFENLADQWGLGEKSFSNGAAVADLNNDGCLDIVINNIDHPAYIYKGNCSGNHWLNVKVENDLQDALPTVYIYAGDHQQKIEIRRVRGYFSSSEAIAHFGLGTYRLVDSLRVEWKEGTSKTLKNILTDRTLFIRKSELSKAWTSKQKEPPKSYPFFESIDPSALGLDYTNRENRYDDFRREVLLPYKQSTLGPPITAGDINGDGKEDLIIGGAAGQPTQIYFNGKKGFNHFIPASFLRDAYHEDGGFVLFDEDGDGDLDLFVVSAGNAGQEGDSMYVDRLYENPGNGNYQKRDDFRFGGYSGMAAVAMDIDKDGRMDLIVGNRIVPHTYPFAPASYVLMNTPSGWVERTTEIAPGLKHAGIVNAMLATDFDGDGWQDLIAVGEWEQPHFYKNENGVLNDLTKRLWQDSLWGWWWSVAEVDCNGDTLPDYFLGNAGLNMKYKASMEKPFEVFAGDVDHNQSWDVILAHPEGQKIVPVRGRECSSQQMPFIKKKFKSYDAYASASLEDIYGDSLNNLLSKHVTEFRSVVLQSKKGGGYEMVPIPWKAQLFPVKTILKPEMKNDTNKVIFLIGDEYNTEVETPRWDAGHGLVLRLNGAHQPLSLSPVAGWPVRGNIKNGTHIKMYDGTHLIVLAENNGRLHCLKYIP